MLTWERLRTPTHDIKKLQIYYVIMDTCRDRFELYYPHPFRDEVLRIEYQEDGDQESIQQMAQVYFSMWKTNKKVMPNEYLQKLRPPHDEYYCISCKLSEFRAEQKRRRLNGEKCRLKLAP